MHDDRFDALARLLAVPRPRRRVLRVLVGAGAAGVLGLFGAGLAAAKPGGRRCGLVGADCSGDGDCCSSRCGGDGTCAGGPSTCPVTGQTRCFGHCVDLGNDRAHCGGCRYRCAEGQVCSDYACRCPAGTALCHGACKDTENDFNNCGGCGHACARGATCSRGACECPPGTVVCGGDCVDPESDADNCGACGTVCSSVHGEICTLGRCTCPAGFAHCGEFGYCKDLANDLLNCGGCGQTCEQGTGYICCDGTCCGVGQLCCPGPGGISSCRPPHPGDCNCDGPCPSTRPVCATNLAVAGICCSANNVFCG